MLQRLRKAGEALAQFDERYANRAAKDMGGITEHPVRVMLGGTPLNQMSVERADSQIENVLAHAALAGAGASNVAYRYGLPAAGVTLAGKGLYDLATEYGGQADTPEPNQLSLQ